MAEKHTSTVKETIRTVCKIMESNGYDPVKQLSGYLMTEDPSYIPPYENARLMITQLDRDEIFHEIVESYIKDAKNK